MKTLEFNYDEKEIHFSLNPFNQNVMVNATEMAKIFDKRTDHYLQNESTKKFIEALSKVPEMSGTLIENRGRNGIYFERKLALDFATWLDVDFRVWVFTTIDEIVFGNYKKHWEAHAIQEQQKQRLEQIKAKMLLNPTPEIVANYFECEREINNAKRDKSKAIRNQIRLFDTQIPQLEQKNT